jgi:hypothetical protein
MPKAIPALQQIASRRLNFPVRCSMKRAKNGKELCDNPQENPKGVRQ